MTSTIELEAVPELPTLVAVHGSTERADTTGDICLSIAIAIASGPVGPHK